MVSQQTQTFNQRLQRTRRAREIKGDEYDFIALVDDEEEVTQPDHGSEIHIGHYGPVPKVIPTHDSGSVPSVEIEETTAERCVICGRPPGVVSAPGADRFDLGVKHALNRLGKLLIDHGIPKDEADAIVQRLTRADVELP
jgi:hypothetical protein